MPVLISRTVVIDQLVQQVFRHAVVTVLSSLTIPMQTLVGDLVVSCNALCQPEG
jgi:hypothetical protein